MKKIYKYFIILMTFILNFSCKSKSDQSKIKGLVPYQETAIKIAEAVWLARFGDMILEEKPYVAKLEGNVWMVEGTLHHTHGGVAFIELHSSDRKILGLWHTK